MANTILARVDRTVTPPLPSTAIDVRQVSKSFGDVLAVDLVDLSIHCGEMFGLIGHNGAGKSTLFKMMLGLIPASGGEILVQGVDTTAKGFRDVRRHIGYVPENVVLYDNLTGLETLQFFARLKGASEQTCGVALERVGLSSAADRRVHGYSKGMRQRLGFAQAMLGAPQLMFLDEPTSGLDPEAIRDFYRMLGEFKAEGVTLVLSSHILSEIQERVDRLAIMAAGKVRAVGTLQSLREHVHLPVRIIVSLAAANASRLLDECKLMGIDASQRRSDQIEISCTREQKIQMITRLSQLAYPVADLQIHEPSLEDVFFGFTG